MNSKKEKLGARIKYLRQQAKMRQEGVAEAVGIDAKSLSRIERGTHYPSLETLEAISKTLGIPMREFFDEPSESEEELRNHLAHAAKTLPLHHLRLISHIMKLLIQKP